MIFFFPVIFDKSKVFVCQIIPSTKYAAAVAAVCTSCAWFVSCLRVVCIALHWTGFGWVGLVSVYPCVLSGVFFLLFYLLACAAYRMKTCRRSGAVLKIEAWDWDRSSADDPLGHFEVTIGEELLSQQVGGWAGGLSTTTNGLAVLLCGYDSIRIIR